jgi:hypothetical protein
MLVTLRSRIETDQGRSPMPRIIVTTDPPSQTGEDPVLLDERVNSVHLSTDHAAAQLVERLAWAIGDAERAERATLTP